jgi:TatD DNase family protein
MLTICTKLDDFPAILRLAESDPGIWCTVGTHPHEAATDPDITAADLVELTRHAKVVGIGEAGLDYFYDHSPRDRQKTVFHTHAAAAREAGVPLVVHTRDADDDTGDILQAESAGGSLQGVLHCFSSGKELAFRALDLGFYISLSGMITFKKADDLRDIVRSLPLDRLLIETDSPFLAPVPFRGKRNEPSFVVHTAAKLAELKNVAIEEIEATTTQNFHRLFGKVPQPA